MAETWLRPNARALWFAMVIPAALAVVGLLVAIAWPQSDRLWIHVLGALLAAVGLFFVVHLVGQLRQPRLAYQSGQLLVYLRSGPPIRVPIEIVDCFFLGQAPSLLPGKQYEQTETAAVVIRLAESAREWSHAQVKPAWGKWCEGYITIRGTWCERLDIAKVNRLNQRLAEVQRELRQAGTAP